MVRLADLPPDERLPAAMDLLGLDYARLAENDPGTVSDQLAEERGIKRREGHDF